MKVLIVNANDPFCQLARASLESAEGVSAVQEAGSGPEVISLICELRPDLVLIDLDSMGSDALEIVAEVIERYPESKIIVMATSGQEDMVLAAFRMGARGHLIKGKNDPGEIMHAIRAVCRGESLLSPAIAGAILDEMTHRYRFSHTACRAS